MSVAGGLVAVWRGVIVGSSRHRLRLLSPAWLTLLAAAALTAFGVAGVDTALNTDPVFDTGGLHPKAHQQMVFGYFGLAAAFMIAAPHYKFIRALAWPSYAVAVVLLVVLLLAPASIAPRTNGAKAWLWIGGFNFQPAEIAKVAFVLASAAYLRCRSEHREFLGLIVPGLIAAVPVGLITLQPDLGSASLFGPALFAVLIAAGAKLRHLALIVACCVLVAPATYPFLAPHQKSRIEGMMMLRAGDTSASDGVNFQPETAQRLIGAGGAFGVGRESARTLVRYNRLPEAHNDMVFSVIVLRFGLLGACGLLVLYGVWLFGAVATAALSADPFGRLCCVGLAAFVAAQVVVNIGMNLGLLPIIGITLPFVSAGGSSLLTVWGMTGLIISVGIHPSALKRGAGKGFEFDEAPTPTDPVDLLESMRRATNARGATR